MDSHTVPTKTADLTTRRIDDFVFIVDPHTSELHSLNDVGGFIWGLLDGASSIADVAATVASEYEVDEATARKDVEEFVAELATRGLLSA